MREDADGRKSFILGSITNNNDLSEDKCIYDLKPQDKVGGLHHSAHDDALRTRTHKGDLEALPTGPTKTDKGEVIVSEDDNNKSDTELW